MLAILGAKFFPFWCILLYLSACVFAVVLHEVWAQKSSAVISQMERVVAVVSYFSLHSAFQWIQQSFNKVFATQIRHCMCWKGDRNCCFFWKSCLVLTGTTEWPTGERCICSSMPRVWEFFCFPKHSTWTPEPKLYSPLIVFFCNSKFLLKSLNGLVPSTLLGEETVPTG